MAVDTKSLILIGLLIIQINSTKIQCFSDEVHALILARGGSKGIPLKNLVEINGRSLLGRSIATIQKSGQFRSIWVSTDSNRIAEEALQYGALVHRRSIQTARDETTSLASVQEFLEVHPTIRRFALFQCTSVFLSEHYIHEAVQQFQRNECVFAVKRSHALRWKAVGNQITPLNFNVKQRPRRQEWIGELVEAGMFYFATRQLAMEQGLLQNHRCGYVIIDEVDALEIDHYDDLLLAKCLIIRKEPATEPEL